VASLQLTLLHQALHILCHIIQFSVPEWCSVCVSELWPFVYSSVGVIHLLFAAFFSPPMKKLNPVIWIWSFADCI
jgi:hypothetical protein